MFIDKFWIYITSLQVFFHHATDIDTCADSSAFKFYDKPTAFIQKKTTGFDNDYFEIVIGDRTGSSAFNIVWS